MGASTSIEHPPAPSDTTGAWILPYLYTVFLWFFHGFGLGAAPGQGKARNCHELVILRD